MTYRSDLQVVTINKEEKKKKKLPTPQERFIKMNEKNKNLLVLKKEFNLEFI